LTLYSYSMLYTHQRSVKIPEHETSVQQFSLTEVLWGQQFPDLVFSGSSGNDTALRVPVFW